MESVAKERDRLNALVSCYRALESELGWSVTANKGDMTRPDGSYIMVPFNPFVFMRSLETVKEILINRGYRKSKDLFPTFRFVDVGAGLGFKVKMAKHLGFAPDGVEFDKKYVNFAKKYFKLHLIHEDALKFDYKDYDVIYFYRPIACEEMQEKLEKRILSTMRDDAIVMGVYATNSFHHKVDHIEEETCIKKGKAHLFPGVKLRDFDRLVL